MRQASNAARPESQQPASHLADGSQRGNARLWPALAAGSTVVGLVLFFFWKIVFTNLILIGVDSFLYFYPYRDYISQALLEGRFPLWNPHLFMGVPLFANMQAAVLYPLHWPLLWFSAPKQVAVSIVLHVALAGLGTLALARRTLRLGWPGALTSALVFALGGFVGSHAEHINQLNVAAWLPWTFLLLDVAAHRRCLRWTLVLGLVIALMVLAGHAQALYISLSGLALYALLGGWGEHVANTRLAPIDRLAHYLGKRASHLLVMFVALLIAALLSAVQLLPTLELASLSARSGGLPYREVVSFSLRPWLLHYTLLPPYGQDLSQVFGEAHGEYVAYVGVLGLGLAGLGAWRTMRARAPGRFFLLLAGLGLFLALGIANPAYYLLYQVVPGFDLFRAPARWMLLYALGVAVLAGLGMQRLTELGWMRGAYLPVIRRAPSRLCIPTGVLTALCLELLVVSQSLRYNQPSAPEAFSFWRPSIAFLRTDDGPHRFLSLSGIQYDPGDQPEMEAMLHGQLPEGAMYDYVVAAKQKEVLAYNLPLQFRLNSVDGYDGGLLPLRDFVTLEHLFLEPDRLSLDGRLRQNLRHVPPGRLLSLLGVKYIITDKVYDVWVDGVFYDLQFSARLGLSGTRVVQTQQLPPFPTTALGIMSYLEGALDVPDDTPVARISLTDARGGVQRIELLAGQHTSEGRYKPQAKHRQARIGHNWPDDPDGHDYLAFIELPEVCQLSTVSMEAISSVGTFVLRGLSLVDTRTQTSQQIILSTEGRYRLVHSGDVKIYENLEFLPRAFLVHQAEISSGDEATLVRLRDPTFDPAQSVILSAEEGLSPDQEALYWQEAGVPGEDKPPVAEVTILEYAPERVLIQANSQAAGYLVLSDTYYPGWTATVDSRPAAIHRANLMMRAVRLGPGTHQVEFRYQPTSLQIGVWISGAAWVAWIVVITLAWSRRCGGRNEQVRTVD